MDERERANVMSLVYLKAKYTFVRSEQGLDVSYREYQGLNHIHSHRNKA